MNSRPGAVTFVGIMMFIGAGAYLAGAIVNLFLWLRPDQVQTWYGQPISDWYWVINGGLNLVLVVGFAWIGRMALAGDYAAGVTVNMLAVINLVFAFFSLLHGYGWVALAVSIIVLIANNTAAAQAYYRRNLPAAA
jgi:hypothetical protein